MLLEDQYGVGDTVDLGEATGVVETTGVPSSRSARWAIVGIVATTVSLSKPPGVRQSRPPSGAPASAPEKRQQGLGGVA